METIGDRLQKLLRAHGLSQKDVAGGLGKSPQMMSHLLGQADPPPEFVREFCAYLKEPLYKAILSKEDIDGLSGIDPALTDIVELLRKALGYPQPERTLILSSVRVLLRNAEELHRGNGGD